MLLVERQPIYMEIDARHIFNADFSYPCPTSLFFLPSPSTSPPSPLVNLKNSLENVGLAERWGQKSMPPGNEYKNENLNRCARHWDWRLLWTRSPNLRPSNRQFYGPSILFFSAYDPPNFGTTPTSIVWAASYSNKLRGKRSCCHGSSS